MALGWDFCYMLLVRIVVAVIGCCCWLILLVVSLISVVNWCHWLVLVVGIVDQCILLS